MEHTIDDPVPPSTPSGPSPEQSLEQAPASPSPLPIQFKNNFLRAGGDRSALNAPRPWKLPWQRTMEGTMPSPSLREEGSPDESPRQPSTPSSSSVWIDVPSPTEPIPPLPLISAPWGLELPPEPSRRLSAEFRHQPRGDKSKEGSLYHASQVTETLEHTNPVSAHRSDTAIEALSSVAIPYERPPAQEGTTTSAFPKPLLDSFVKLNAAIANFCGDTAESALGSGPFGSVDVGALQAAFPEGGVLPSMVMSEQYTLRPLKDVIDWGLRSVINKALCDEIFDPFHPSLSLRVGGVEGIKFSQYLKDIYYSVLPEGADDSMARAEAGTFMLLDCLVARDNPQASSIDDILSALTNNRIMPLLHAIFGAHAYRIPIGIDPLRAIIQGAYKWNHNVKSLVPPADLRAFVVPNTGRFNAGTMLYCGRAMESSESSGKEVIICAGSIGLKLYDRECLTGRVLLKVVVLTPQNYGDG
ncbi:uncharacterized protein EI90DRAFT_3032820 [Cantharellus anzutake]|uniref:uncharacterized protein n=1 Tax=Cantharellus anzutake TaxID=1750568 RepID=UPI001906B782|nr:uncharacterized protein EI90DRAFT_3032820 [Cantharellus anzutake]KAF8342298.1 hypothetical protein EI90DRAFT_3032820 [Cantharellus anzutake]